MSRYLKGSPSLIMGQALHSRAHLEALEDLHSVQAAGGWWGGRADPSCNRSPSL